VLGIVGRNTDSFAYFRSFNEAVETLQELPHAIIQTELYKDQDKNNEILRFAQEHHISYRFIPGNSDMFVGNIDVELFAGLPVIAVHQTALVGWGRILKRLFDLFASLVLLIILSPVLLLITVLIGIFDRRGPVLFRQTRLTRFNRTFTVYKFRTMKQRYSGMTPEEAFAAMDKPKLAEVYRTNGDFLPDDPRISTIGRFLRRTSLDELPQLFNVLKGDLSLVGPRALIPQELSEYEKRHTILSVKSGLTGLAQVSGRRDISFDERRKLDMYYVQNWSFWLDVSILLRTVRTVFAGQGAK
jgi:exopolysaccharide biosynthesis polyprenyl glycosylphosphotransferase